MDMEKRSEADLGVAQEAYEWFATLRESGPQEHAAFVAWLKASPRHVGEFLSVMATYRHYSSVDPERRIDLNELIAAASSNVVPLEDDRFAAAPQVSSSAGRRKRWTLGIAAAIAAIAVVAAGLLTLRSSQWRAYENAIGEIRSFELADGSVIHLNTRSKVEVRLSNAAREVELLAGEALFKVARDPGRPFRVRSGPATIQAVGTQFNVYRQRQATTIAVIEGAIRVVAGATGADAQDLFAGQGARVAPDGKVAALATVDTAKVIAWRQRRLIFRDDTLADIAAEFNRYNEKPRFRVEGERTAAMRFTGVFDAEAPESFVRVLGGIGSLSAEKQGDEVVIRER